MKIHLKNIKKSSKMKLCLVTINIKSFNLESTNITDLKRLSSIFKLLSISYAFLYCSKIIITRDYRYPIKIKLIQ